LGEFFLGADPELKEMIVVNSFMTETMNVPVMHKGSHAHEGAYLCLQCHYCGAYTHFTNATG